MLSCCKMGIITTVMTSSNNSAAKDGNFLYGGLLDKCQMIFLNRHIIFEQDDYHYLSGLDEQRNDISSQPYQLCFCLNSAEYNCSEVKSFKSYRGQSLRVSLLALNQVRKAVPTRVRAITRPSASLKLNQNLRLLLPSCHKHTFNVYSTEDHEELVLYPDGPCHDTGLAKAIIKIAMLPCPHAFIQSDENCVCEERLQEFGAECLIDEEIYIVRTNFWMGMLFANDLYQGLILYRACPDGFCATSDVNITLDNLEALCGLNHGGVLYGKCTANHSLLLGGSQCGKCSNVFLASSFGPFCPCWNCSCNLFIDTEAHRGNWNDKRCHTLC